MKRIITLSSDFGLRDHYVGSMKGVILGINPDCNIVDITHEIPKYDVFRGAITVRNFYKNFPKDTIHVVVVDPGVGTNRKPIAIKTEYGVFIGPDNGVFSFIYDESKQLNIYEITNTSYMLPEVSNTFHGRDVFAPAAAHLSLGIDIKELGGKIQSPVLLDIEKPKVSDSELVGNVIYVDSFGNLITNIPSDLTKDYDKVQIGELIIDSVASSYQDVEKGEILAIVGSSGYLEISINQGSAAKVIKDREIKLLK